MVVTEIQCACGCGLSFPQLDKWQRVRRYAPGHQFKHRAKSAIGRTIIGGYWNIKMHGHPHADRNGYVREHQFLAEKALGCLLPYGAEVHHATGNRLDNTSLVICQSKAYHKLLHSRMRIRDAGGNPNTDKICSTCKAIKPKTEFGRNSSTHDGINLVCRKCANAKTYNRNMRIRGLAQ